MIRWTPWLALAACAAGCVTVEKQPQAPAMGASRLSAARITHVVVQADLQFETSNSQLQLPAVSPNGRYVAALQLRGEPLPLAALFTGEGLEAMSLHLRPVAGDAAAEVIAHAGAAWPAWSGDSRKLAFVVYDASGRCDLGIYDVADGGIRRKSVGFKTMMMPALNRSGDLAAVVTAGGDFGRTRLHVIDLASDKIVPCPASEATDRQLWPQWTADGRIVYILIEAGGAWLAQWGPERFPPEKIARINVGGDDFAAYQALASIAQPLSADGARFAYYDVGAGRVVLVVLADGASTPLAAGARAGCWLTPGQFVVADDEEMRLLPEPASGGVRIMSGPWLPRGSDGSTHLIALTRGTHRRAFTLVRLKITPGD